MIFLPSCRAVGPLGAVHWHWWISSSGGDDGAGDYGGGTNKPFMAMDSRILFYIPVWNSPKALLLCLRVWLHLDLLNLLLLCSRGQRSLMLPALLPLSQGCISHPWPACCPRGSGRASEPSPTAQWGLAHSLGKFRRLRAASDSLWTSYVTRCR